MPHNGSGGGHSFSQQTVMHFSSIPGENGQPLVYQASSSTKTGPGGIKETRKAERDSHSGVEKVSISHHIGK
jgi:myeloid leukemia factor 1